jgi:hypothetical protein
MAPTPNAPVNACNYGACALINELKDLEEGHWVWSRSRGRFQNRIRYRLVQNFCLLKLRKLLIFERLVELNVTFSTLGGWKKKAC